MTAAPPRRRRRRARITASAAPSSRSLFALRSTSSRGPPPANTGSTASDVERSVVAADERRADAGGRPPPPQLAVAVVADDAEHRARAPRVASAAVFEIEPPARTSHRSKPAIARASSATRRRGAACRGSTAQRTAPSRRRARRRRRWWWLPPASRPPAPAAVEEGVQGEVCAKNPASRRALVELEEVGEGGGGVGGGGAVGKVRAEDGRVDHQRHAERRVHAPRYVTIVCSTPMKASLVFSTVSRLPHRGVYSTATLWSICALPSVGCHAPKMSVLTRSLAVHVRGEQVAHVVAEVVVVAIVRGLSPSARRYSTIAVFAFVCPALKSVPNTYAGGDARLGELEQPGAQRVLRAAADEGAALERRRRVKIDGDNLGVVGVDRREQRFRASYAPSLGRSTDADQTTVVRRGATPCARSSLMSPRSAASSDAGAGGTTCVGGADISPTKSASKTPRITGTSSSSRWRRGRARARGSRRAWPSGVGTTSQPPTAAPPGRRARDLARAAGFADAAQVVGRCVRRSGALRRHGRLASCDATSVAPLLPARTQRRPTWAAAAIAGRATAAATADIARLRAELFRCAPPPHPARVLLRAASRRRGARVIYLRRCGTAPAEREQSSAIVRRSGQRHPKPGSCTGATQLGMT